jgi:hypothetical protein
MENENLLGLMYGITRSGSLAGRGLQPGEVVSEGDYGDDKRDIDQAVEEAVVDHFLGSDVNAALKPEDAEWGDEEWITPSGETVSGEELEDRDYAFIVDQVEGTKNYDNRDRYTTIAALNPEDPTLEGVEASMIYRWDDSIFFSDGEQSYSNFECGSGLPSGNLEAAKPLEAEKMDEVGYDTKIRGQMIGLNARDYADLIESVVERNDLPENDWPSLKADGTTTGDILGTVTDNSIAVDIRALKDRERLPFAQDFAPAAKVARDAGVKVVDEKGEPIDTDFSRPGAATAYIAVPPGDASEEIVDIVGELNHER